MCLRLGNRRVRIKILILRSEVLVSSNPLSEPLGDAEERRADYLPGFCQSPITFPSESLK